MRKCFKLYFDLPWWKISLFEFSLYSPNNLENNSNYPIITSAKNLIRANYNLITYGTEDIIFCRGKILLPNNPEDLLGNYKFNQSKVVEISRNKVIPPAIISRKIGLSYGNFTDRFINVAAAIYRGDKYAMIYAPNYIKETLNYASEIDSNFS